MAEAATELARHGEECGHEAPSGLPELSDDSDEDPELLEDDGKGGYIESTQHRRGAWRGAVGAPPPFAVFQYPLLQVSSRDTLTRTEATLNLLTNLLGAGLLAMPRAIASAGLITGVALMALMAVANRYTLLLVLQTKETMLQDGTSYPELGRHFFGQGGLLVVVSANLLFSGGILTVYLITLTDVLCQFAVLSDMSQAALVVLAALLCAPGALLRSLRHVAVLSAACMAGVALLVVSLLAVCLGDLLQQAPDAATPLDVGQHGDSRNVELFIGDPRLLFPSASLFALQFSVQAGGVEVLSRLAPDEGTADNGHEASTFPAAQGISKVAFCIAVVVSASVGSVAYIRFGNGVQGDVLLDFDLSEQYAILTVARVVYGLVVTCSFAFVMVPCRFAVLDLFFLHRRYSDAINDAVPVGKFRYVTVGVLLVCAFVAWLVSDLAQMLEFVGVWATMALAFVLPCAFFVELRRRQENMPVFSAANMLPLGLVLFGVLVSAFNGAELILGFLGRWDDPIASGASGDRAIVQDLSGAMLGGNASN